MRSRVIYPKFKQVRWFYWTRDFGTRDVSLGIHVCWKGRIDIHVLFGMLSFGRVPIYEDRAGKLFACSNSYHAFTEKHDAEMQSKLNSEGKAPPFRAST